jgi:hypothetical protein
MKRLMWFVAGAGSGVWAQRAAKKRLRRYTPPAAVERARQSTVKVARDVKTAVREGRTAASDYRDDARAEVQADRARRRIRPVRDAG